MSSRATKILFLAQSKQQDDNLTTVPVCVSPQICEKNTDIDYVNLCSSQDNLPDVSPLQVVENNSDSEVDFDSDDSVADKNYVPSSSDSESGGNCPDDEFLDYCDTGSDVEVEEAPVTKSVDSCEWYDIDEPSNNNTCIYRRQEMSIMNFDILSVKTCLNAYELFLTEDLVCLIVQETNRYARQMLTNQNSSKSRLNLWVDCDEKEIKRFFAIVLVMGLNDLPSLNLYWSKDPMFHNEFIAGTMTRDRFLLLLRCIHFCNNETADKSDRLYKIRNLLDVINENFKEVLTPGRVIVIDESMVPFQGRLIFKQYIPNKTHPYGIKLYKLCTVDGYTYNIIVYTGKNERNAQVSHSEQIVHDLLKNIDAKDGYYLYADNFYSSLHLAESLFEQGIIYCGTMRSNRKGIPKSLPNKMKRGDICGKQRNFLRIIKWMDKRPVLMLSTDPSHEAKCIPTGKRTREGHDILKPKVITDYNKAKKGVDFSDQMSSYHSVLRRSLKWYRKLIFEILFGTCIVNSWIIFNKISSSKVSITEFRRKLAQELVVTPTPREDPKTPKRVRHTFIKPSGPGKKKRRQCQGCYNKLRETHTSREASNLVTKITSYCSDCPGKPGMCLSCFNENHKKLSPDG